MMFARSFAMVVYTHWYGRLLEPGLWLGLLFVASVVLLGRGLLRNFPLRGRYFSGWFVLSLCPFLCLSLLGMIHTQEWRSVDNSVQKLGEVLQVETFALIVSVVEIILYTLVYLASRKRLSALRPSPVAT